MIKKIKNKINQMVEKTFSPRQPHLNDKITIKLINSEKNNYTNEYMADYFYSEEEDIFRVLIEGEKDYLDFPTEEIESVSIVDCAGNNIFNQSRQT